MSFFLTFGATPTKATDSLNGYVSRYTIQTHGRSDWDGGEGTAVSASTVERNGKYVISFYAGNGSENLTASYGITSMPAVNFDVTTLTFKLLLYVDDIGAIKDSNGNFLGGEIGFYGKKIHSTPSEDGSENIIAEEDVFYTWDLSQINLKKGWNRLTLNFKTAKTDSVPTAYTFEGITEFRITARKNNAANLIVAVDNAEVCILSIESDGSPVAPITDTHTVKELALAAGVAFAIVGGITAGIYVHSKKEEQRRLRERRAKIRARKEARQNQEKE